MICPIMEYTSQVTGRNCAHTEHDRDYEPEMQVLKPLKQRKREYSARLCDNSTVIFLTLLKSKNKMDSVVFSNGFYGIFIPPLKFIFTVVCCGRKFRNCCSSDHLVHHSTGNDAYRLYQEICGRSDRLPVVDFKRERAMGAGELASGRPLPRQHPDFV